MLFERKVYRKLRFKRGLSILTVYLLALALVVILLQMILPQVVQSIMDLATNMQYYLNGLERLVQQVTEQFQLEGAGIEESLEFIKNLTSKLTETVASSLPQLLDFGMAVGSGIISGITAVISSIYMLAGKGRLVPQLKKMLYAVVPKRRADKFLQICSHANKVFVGFINGKLIDSAIIGVLCFLLCLILRIPYPMLISVVIGVTNIIPFFGPILGAIPCLMILVIVDPWAALRFLVLVIALQQFDGNILGPKILGDSTGPVRHLGPGGHRGRRRTVRVPGYGAGRAYVRGALRSGAGVGEPPPGRQGDRWKRDAPHKAGRTNRRRIERCSPGRAGGTFFRQALETRRIFVYTKKRESLFCGGLCAVTNIQLFRAIGRVDDALLGRSERTVGNRRIQMRWAPPQT